MDLTPIVSAEEVFAVSEKIRWVALTSDSGDVVLNQMRPGVQSHSPRKVDEEFVKLGPLMLMGVAEKNAEYMKGVGSIVIWYELAACVFARLGSQVISSSIEKDVEAVSKFLAWLEEKKREVSPTS